MTGALFFYGSVHRSGAQPRDQAREGAKAGCRGLQPLPRLAIPALDLHFDLHPLDLDPDPRRWRHWHPRVAPITAL